jgi:opacity protein-like surface antigen
LTGLTEWKDVPVVGARIGFWFKSIPFLGLAVDGSWFRPEEDVSNNPAKIDVVPISALAMARLPLLRSQLYPNGRVQPYVGAGVGAFYTQLKFDTAVGTRFSHSSWDVGADLRGGATFMFTPFLGLFAEYRFTWVEPTWKGDVLGVTEKIKIELETHHVVGGLTLRF